MIIGTIILIILTSFVGISSRWLRKKSDSIYDDINILKTQCLEINNKEEYNKCFEEYKRLVKLSFVRYHRMMLSEIYGIIETKHHDHADNNE